MFDCLEPKNTTNLTQNFTNKPIKFSLARDNAIQFSCRIAPSTPSQLINLDNPSEYIRSSSIIRLTSYSWCFLILQYLDFRTLQYLKRQSKSDYLKYCLFLLSCLFTLPCMLKNLDRMWILDISSMNRSFSFVHK